MTPSSYAECPLRGGQRDLTRAERTSVEGLKWFIPLKEFRGKRLYCQQCGRFEELSQELLERDIQCIRWKFEHLAASRRLQWYLVYGHSVCVQDAGSLERRVGDGDSDVGSDNDLWSIGKAEDLFTRAAVDTGGLRFPAKRTFGGAHLDEN